MISNFLPHLIFDCGKFSRRVTGGCLRWWAKIDCGPTGTGETTDIRLLNQLLLELKNTAAAASSLKIEERDGRRRMLNGQRFSHRFT